MERILKDYQETITKIEERIKELKAEKLKERDVLKLHKLEWRIDILIQERLEMMKTCAEIREYLRPKEPSQYEVLLQASGDY